MFYGIDEAPVTLEEYCQNRGLLRGLYALRWEMDFVEYFKMYGLDIITFSYLVRHSAQFAWEASVNGDGIEHAMLSYAEQHGLEVFDWLPPDIHVLVEIWRMYPKFYWITDLERCAVKLFNYPQVNPEKRPSLYELVSGWTLMPPNYVDFGPYNWTLTESQVYPPDRLKEYLESETC